MPLIPISHGDGLVASVVEAARGAGTLALAFFRPGAATSAGISHKAGGSPVTEADYLVDRFLKEHLETLVPEAGWLSEETKDTSARLSKEIVLVVDPIDGTRGFMRGNGAWAIAIALVEQGRPVIGVVHAPALGETYVAVTACGGKWDRAVGDDSGGPNFPIASLTLGGITKKGNRYIRKLLVLSATSLLRSVSKRKGALADWISALLAKKPARLVTVALANKLARIIWAIRPQRFRRLRNQIFRDMREPMPELKPRHSELSEASGLFTDPAAAALRTSPLQQVWREHLLAQSMIDNGLYDEGYLVVIAPALNYHVQDAAEAYQAQLRDPEDGKVRFVNVALEDVIEVIRLSDPAHADALHHRYCDFWLVDRELELNAPTFGVARPRMRQRRKRRRSPNRESVSD
jgi:hypothetical protein